MKLWLMENINFVYTVDRMINRLWPQLEDFYLNKTWENLSCLNRYLIIHISREFLGIKTKFSKNAEGVSCVDPITYSKRFIKYKRI